MKFTQICPIPEGWWAVFDGAADGDETADREVIALAITDKGEIAALVLDSDESKFVPASSIPGYSGLAYENTDEENQEEEEQERAPIEVGDVAKRLEKFRQEREEEP